MTGCLYRGRGGLIANQGDLSENVAGPQLGLFPPLSTLKKAVLASLLGTLAIARSTSSTLAVIKECKARARFSETSQTSSGLGEG